MKRVATIILNRNLPEVTDRLVEHLQRHDGDATDAFVPNFVGKDMKPLMVMTLVTPSLSTLPTSCGASLSSPAATKSNRTGAYGTLLPRR